MDSEACEAISCYRRTPHKITLTSSSFTKA